MYFVSLELVVSYAFGLCTAMFGVVVNDQFAGGGLCSMYASSWRTGVTQCVAQRYDQLWAKAYSLTFTIIGGYV